MIPKLRIAAVRTKRCKMSACDPEETVAEYCLHSSIALDNVRKVHISTRNIKLITIPTFALLVLCACASNFAVYESPTSGRLSKITFVNAAETQKANLATFDDGITCTRRRYIQFENEDAIPAGNSRSLTVATDREFALFATLATIETDEYGVDIGMTGGGPAPVMTRTIMAIGCNAKLSFEVEPEKDYHIVVSEPTSSGPCSVVVSEIDKEGELVAVETTQRIVRSPRDELGSFCEPLVE